MSGDSHPAKPCPNACYLAGRCQCPEEDAAMFKPTPYKSHTAGWFASVTREGYSNGYWRAPRLTRWGAAWASRRKAWWLNRTEAL